MLQTTTANYPPVPTPLFPSRRSFPGGRDKRPSAVAGCQQEKTKADQTPEQPELAEGTTLPEPASSPFQRNKTPSSAAEAGKSNRRHEDSAAAADEVNIHLRNRPQLFKRKLNPVRRVWGVRRGPPVVFVRREAEPVVVQEGCLIRHVRK